MDAAQLELRLSGLPERPVASPWVPAPSSAAAVRFGAAAPGGGTGTWQLTGETRYVYDGLRVIQERDGSNTPLVSYTRGKDLSGSFEGAGGIGGLLGRSHGYSAGNWSTHNFYHADGNGNITYLVDSSQTLAASYQYDPYGNLLASSGTLAAANVYRFSSKELHLNSGLYSYGYRFYSPDWQRWPNRDPIGELGGLNLYGYVANNPINLIDPFGLLTAVFVGGPSPADDQNSSGNPFGHAAIATTGNGIYSFGTPEKPGSSFTDFLNNQATYRDGTVYILNTTPEQEQAILDYLKKQKGKKLGRYPDNCANRVIGALDAAGIHLTQQSLASPIGMPIAEPISKFPSSIAYALSYPGSLKISVPKGTTLPPKFMTGFNPKP